MVFVVEFPPSLHGIVAARPLVVGACRVYGFGLTGRLIEKSEKRYNDCVTLGEYSDNNIWMRFGWLHLNRREWGGSLQRDA